MTKTGNLLSAALAAAIICAGVTAAPAHAAMSFGFDWSIVDDEDGRDDGFFFHRRLCILTDRGLREAIADQGYDHIYLNVPVGRYVQARATHGDWVYLLRVNACTGTIVDRDRLRRS